MIRCVYKPYHPWRHGYRREKRKRRLLLIARILLVLECLWFSYGYIKNHMVERTMLWKKAEFTESGEELYGIGFGPKNGILFWFHSCFEEPDGQEEMEPVEP